MNRRLSLSLLSLSIAFSAARAKPGSDVPSTSFEGKPSGARYIGLGETGAALPGMPESPIWNPACMGDLAGPVFSADFDVARRSDLNDDVLLGNVPLRGRKLTYLGFASGDGAFYFRPLANYDQTIVTNAADPLNNFTQESLKINQIGFSAVQTGEKGSNTGINLSYLNAHRGFVRAATGQAPVLELADGNGFSMDVGLRGTREPFSAGLVFFNIPGIIYWDRYDSDQLPVIMRGGLAFTPVPQFTFAADYEKRFYRGGLPKPDFLHMGMEIALASWFQLRGGTFGEDLSDRNKSSQTFGFSVSSPRKHQLDFAIRSYHVLDEKVLNYFLSIVLPMPSNNVQDDYSS